jgi:hypothetical protein
MGCIGCGSVAVSERSERTAQGYRRFRCRACGFKSPRSAAGSCRAYDELRDFLRSRSRTNQQVSADYPQVPLPSPHRNGSECVGSRLKNWR